MCDDQADSGGRRPRGWGRPHFHSVHDHTRTDDVAATLAQIRTLAAAGCDIVRVAVPDMAAARAVGKIKEDCPIPLVVDIHFDYKLAPGGGGRRADKVRINPGNIGGEDRVKAVAGRPAAERRPHPHRGKPAVPWRSPFWPSTAVSRRRLWWSRPLAHIRLLEKFDFTDICVSLKSSSVPVTMKAYQLMSQESDYPLHVGVTEAGTVRMGTLKSAVGVGGLLALGIGDTMRVSLSADPVEEVYAAGTSWKAAGIRKEGAELVSCPTCGRTRIDLISLANEVEERLRPWTSPSPWPSWAAWSTAPARPPPPTAASPGAWGRAYCSKKGRSSKRSPQDRWWTSYLPSSTRCKESWRWRIGAPA